MSLGTGTTLALPKYPGWGYKKFVIWKVQADASGSVRVHVEGFLDEAAGRASAEAVVGLLGEGKRTLVLEVGEMQGYKRGARQAWKDLLWPRRSAIAGIELVGANSFVGMGASVLAMALGVPLVRRDDPNAGSQPVFAGR